MKKIALLTFYLLIVSCAYFSAHGRAFKRAESYNKYGKYEQAVYAAVDALRLKPEYNEVEKILDAAFPKAIKKHHRKIERLKEKQPDFYWDKIVDELRILQDLKIIIEDLNHPKTDIWLAKANIRNYITEIEVAKSNAAEDHYKIAIQLKSKSDRESQKQAAEQFQLAQSFVGNYKDSQELYLVCKDAGTTRIAILPFINKSGKNQYGTIGENISNAIRSALINDFAIMEFVQIIDRQQIEKIIEEQKLSQSGLIDSQTSLKIGKLLGVHQIISGEVTFLTASNPQHVKNKQRYNKEVVIDTEKYTDEDGKSKTRNVYGDVMALATSHNLSASSQIQASYQVINAETAQVLNSELVSGNRQFEYRWVTFNGDQRALPNDVKRLSKKPQKSAPSKEQLVLDAINNLNEKMIRKIKKVYK